MGRPEGFRVTVRNMKVSAGAGFVVVLTGDVMTMPGLPKVPAAVNVDVDENGKMTFTTEIEADQAANRVGADAA